jgi:hypothetical protein
VHYAAAAAPSSVAIGDLDGDQVPDLAVANAFSDNVSILLGVGYGTFAAAVNYAAGNYPISVAIGDLDGDQVPDLAVANAFSDNVSVLLGVGDGTFAAAVNYAAGDGPWSVAIGDLDGDLAPDLAVANYLDDNVSVLLGLGDGTFAAAVHYATGDWPRSVAIGDLDGDQVPDLAVANYAFPFSGNVSVLLGLGDGTFAVAADYAAGNGPHSVAIGDLDGDQVPDLAVANSGTWPTFDGNVSVLLGVGNGQFAAAVNYAVGDEPSSVAIGDLNGDQVPDLAVANSGWDNVSVLLGLGDGTFAAAVYYPAGNGPRSVAIGDLNGDQVPDLAVANGYSGNISVLLGLGDGAFAGAVNYAAGDGPWSLAIGDLDNDQVPDLAVANWGGNVSVLLGIGDGTFAAAVDYPAGNGPVSVAIGDLDGDQVPDLAVANVGSDNVSLLPGLGDGTFAAAVNYAAGDGPFSVAIGDLDGDQAPDLAVANGGSDNVSVLLGLGDGTFGAAMYYCAGPEPCFVAIGDLNGDQAPDLAVVNGGHPGSSVSVLLHQIPGLFQDCNGNGILDEDDIASGTSLDCNGDAVPDECEEEVVPCGGLDVRPGGCPNPLNRNSHGVLPVALFGAGEFDVTEVDVSSVLLWRADGVGGPVAPNEGPPGPHSTFGDVATPFDGEACDCHDETGDGIVDLVLKFRTDAVVEALLLAELNHGDEIELIITGTLFGGAGFTTAGDCVLIVPQGTSNANVTSNVADLFVELSPPDLNVDGPGFADFQRIYNPGTVITLTAPRQADGLLFQAWQVDGVLQNAGQTTIDVTIVENLTLNAVYTYWQRRPNLAPAPSPTSRRLPPIRERPY